jgi:hypothetical protein
MQTVFLNITDRDNATAIIDPDLFETKVSFRNFTIRTCGIGGSSDETLLNCNGTYYLAAHHIISNTPYAAMESIPKQYLLNKIATKIKEDHESLFKPYSIINFSDLNDDFLNLHKFPYLSALDFKVKRPSCAEKCKYFLIGCLCKLSTVAIFGACVAICLINEKLKVQDKGFTR